MARSILLALLVGLVFSGPSLAADDPAKQTMTFEGRPRTYYLYAPDAGKPAPLLVLLHGSGGNGLFMLGLWKDLAAREGVILLAPDSLRSEVGWDLHADNPALIHALIDLVAANHPVDFHRLYLFGQSGGAVYTLTLSMLESEYFAASALHAGGWRRPAEYRVMEFARRKIPVSISVGNRDEFFSLSSVEATERALTSAGIPVELNVLDGRHHSILDVPPDFYATVWAFLASKRLDGVPTYTSYGLGDTPSK
jgi:poly(3-hydroxybutyrate) depolymerase